MAKSPIKQFYDEHEILVDESPKNKENPETALQRRMAKKIEKETGWDVVRLNSSIKMRGSIPMGCYYFYRLAVKSGFHDLFVFKNFNGITVVIFIEVKMPGKGLEPSQKKVHEYMQRKGLATFVAETEEQALEIVWHFDRQLTMLTEGFIMPKCPVYQKPLPKKRGSNVPVDLSKPVPIEVWRMQQALGQR